LGHSACPRRCCDRADSGSVTVTAPTGLPQYSDLANFLGANAVVDPTQGAACIAYVAQLVSAYVRGVGFTTGAGGALIPNADLWQVILGASARVWAHPRQLPVDQTEGQESVSWRAGFNGWSVAETLVLDRYRVRAL
jgi:hypothetical protein